MTTGSIDEEATLPIVEEETPGMAAAAIEEASKVTSVEEIEAALEVASVEATEVVASEEVEAASVEGATMRTMMSPTGILSMTIKCARVLPFSQPPKEEAMENTTPAISSNLTINRINNKLIITNQATIKVVVQVTNNHHLITNKNNERTFFHEKHSDTLKVFLTFLVSDLYVLKDIVLSKHDMYCEDFTNS